MKKVAGICMAVIMLTCLIWISCVISEKLPVVHSKAGTDGTDVDVSVGGDLIPSVYVNDKLYVSASSSSGYSTISEKCIYLGDIKECVGSGQIPTENFQANYAPVGTKVYQYDSVILMLENGQYCPYEMQKRTEEKGFFDCKESLEVLLLDQHYVKESGDLETTKTPVILTEEETEELLDLLEPYADTLTSDTLKTDYLRYYSIKIDDRLTLTIDPEIGNYGENGDSYMFVLEQGACIKGTYIDEELVNFLAEHLATQ